jgi:hypothetical protein
MPGCGRCDFLKRLIFTEEEREPLEADRKQCKEWETAHFEEQAEAARGLRE